MKKLFVLAGVVLALTGCALKTRSIPGAPIPFASADYSVLGNTSAEACGTYIFGLDIPHLFSDQVGKGGAAAADPISAIIGMVASGGAEEGRAMYEALEKMPDATHLLAPRFETKASGVLINFPMKAGIPLFGQRCATVTAKGVKIGSGPVPGAH